MFPSTLAHNFLSAKQQHTFVFVMKVSVND